MNSHVGVCVCVCMPPCACVYLLCMCFLVPYLHNIRVGSALVGLVVLSVFKEDLVHVCAGILEQLVSAVEDDQGNLAVAQHAQLVRLLHQAKLSLCKCHLGKERDEETKLALKRQLFLFARGEYSQYVLTNKKRYISAAILK